MAKGQKAARVPTVDEQNSSVGKPREIVTQGSRLAREIEQGAPLGHQEPQKRGDTVTPSRLASIKQGKRRANVFPFPGADWQCGVVVLTEQEIQEASIWAGQWTKEAQASMDAVNFAHLVAAEEQVQILWRALVDPETLLPLAASPDELRRLCTRDDINYLTDQYNNWHDQQSPLTSPQISQKQADAVIDALKKAPEEMDLGGLDAASLRLLVTSMASRLKD